MDGLKRSEDRIGRTIWIEKINICGKPNIFYHYDSSGSLMKHTRTIFGYNTTPAEYTRFGEETQIAVVKRKPTCDKLR